MRDLIRARVMRIRASAREAALATAVNQEDTFLGNKVSQFEKDSGVLAEDEDEPWMKGRTTCFGELEQEKLFRSYDLIPIRFIVYSSCCFALIFF